MTREFGIVGVVGLGTMGAGIAEVLARNAVSVVGVEVDAAALERGREHIEQSTARAVAGGKLSESDRTELLGRISFASSLKALADADLVIEAVPESLELKRAIFAELDGIVGAETVLATNTSALSVT